MPGAEGLLAARRAGGRRGADRRGGRGGARRARSRRCRRCAAWRDVAGVKAGATLPARLAADGYERDRRARRRGSRGCRWLGDDGGEPVAIGRRSPAARSRSSPATTLDLERRRAQARRRARAKLEAEIERAERKLANEGFVAKAPAAGRPGRARQAGRAARPSWRRCEPWPEEAERYLLSLELFGMRFGLDRMRRLMTALGHPERQLRVDPRRRHQRQVLDGADDRRDPRAPRAAHRRVPVAAPRSRSASGSGSTTPTSSRRRSPPPCSARRAPPSWSTARSAGEDRVTQFEALTAAAYSELAAPRGRGGGDRGRARRPLRRHQRDPLEGAGADQRRARAHALARADDRRHRRARSSTSSSPAATLVLGAGLHPDADAVARGGGGRARRADRAAPAPIPACRSARSAPSSGATSRSRAAAARGLPRRARRRRRRAAARPRSGCPGACRSSTSEPLTLLDGAHNPDGIAALGRVAARDRARRRDRAGRGRLDPRRQGRGRDAGARCCRRAMRSSSPAVRIRGRLPPPTLQSLARQLRRTAGSRSCATRAPRCARARELAGAGGRRARDRLDLPGRRPAASGRPAAGLDAVNERTTTSPAS